jgi:hypothetical protein
MPNPSGDETVLYSDCHQPAGTMFGDDYQGLLIRGYVHLVEISGVGENVYVAIIRAVQSLAKAFDICLCHRILIEMDIEAPTGTNAVDDCLPLSTHQTRCVYRALSPQSNHRPPPLPRLIENEAFDSPSGKIELTIVLANLLQDL